MKNAAGLLARIFTNTKKDLFTVRLGVTLLLGKFGIAGVLAEVIALPLRGLIGVMIEDGTFKFDLTLDAFREGMKLEEFEKAASDAYVKATAKVYTEAEKNLIRKQYLDVISGIGTVGDGLRQR